MKTIQEIFTVATKVIDVIGVSILLFGFAKSLIVYLITEVKSDKGMEMRRLQNLRCKLGIYILLSLDFLIASDIIQTITELSQKQLIELSVLILLRTVIGYFLGKEVNELEDL